METFDLYEKGVKSGVTTASLLQGIRVSDTYKPFIQRLIDAAQHNGIVLHLASGLRTQAEQIQLRKDNVKDKSKVNDMSYLLTADSSLFNPVTGKPGFSNHQNGKAIDISVMEHPEAYKWLVTNAIKYGFVRTVPTEKWHWEYRPALTQFAVVPKGHPTWAV